MTQPWDVSVLKYTGRPSITTANSYHTAWEEVPRKSPKFLGRASSCSYMPNCGLPHSVSLASIDELGRKSLVTNQQRNCTLPVLPLHRSSPVGSNPLSSGRIPQTLSVCDIDSLASLTRPRTDPMFIDIQDGHQVNFVFSPPSNTYTSSVSPPRQSIGSKRHSYASLRQKGSTPLLMRSSSYNNAGEGTLCDARIPLFVPSQIIQPTTGRPPIPERQSSRACPTAALALGDAAQDEQPGTQETHPKEGLSEASDWSTNVQFEAPKPEVFQSKSEASLTPDWSGTIQQASGAEGAKLTISRSGVPMEVTQFSSGDIESAERGLPGEPNEHGRSRRMLESCYSYFQRLKQHLWPNSNAAA